MQQMSHSLAVQFPACGRSSCCAYISIGACTAVCRRAGIPSHMRRRLLCGLSGPSLVPCCSARGWFRPAAGSEGCEELLQLALAAPFRAETLLWGLVAAGVLCPHAEGTRNVLVALAHLHRPECGAQDPNQLRHLNTSDWQVVQYTARTRLEGLMVKLCAILITASLFSSMRT